MARMIVSEPKIRNMMCSNAHPDGCRVMVNRHVDRAMEAFPGGLEGARGKNVLVVGVTGGYGAPAAAAFYGAGARIFGVAYNTPPQVDPDEGALRADEGWYNAWALRQRAIQDGRSDDVHILLGDAFADETREVLFSMMEGAGVKMDAVVYAVAAGRRFYGGNTWKSTLGTTDEPLESFNINYIKGELQRVTVPVATPEEIEGTVKVMGGEDLEILIRGLVSKNLAAQGMLVGAYSYIGPLLIDLVRRLYWDGSIGRAKKDIDRVTAVLDEFLRGVLGGHAFSVMAPAVTTKSSAIIPSIGPYLAALFGAVEAGFGERDNTLGVGCKLARAFFGAGEDHWSLRLDTERRLRLDEKELAPRLQGRIQETMVGLAAGPMTGDLAAGYGVFRNEFHWLNGFDVEKVDYQAPCEVEPDLREVGVTLMTDIKARRRIREHFSSYLTDTVEPLVREGRLTREADGSITLTGRLDPIKLRAISALTGNYLAGEGAYRQALFIEAQPAIFELVKDATVEEGKIPFHVRQKDEFYGPVAADQAYRMRVTRKKNGDRWIITATFTDEAGATIGVSQSTLIFVTNLRRREAPKPVDVTTLGDLVTETPIKITPELIDVYAGASGDKNPIHTDQEIAQAMDLKFRILHGMCLSQIASAASGLVKDEGETDTQFKTWAEIHDALRAYRRRFADGRTVVSLVNQRNELVLTQSWSPPQAV